MESGVVVHDRKTGALTYRDGTIVGTESEVLVGGWAKVYSKARSHPSFCAVSLGEYSTGRSLWKTPDQGGKPATMICKVAKVQAIREMWPGAFGGVYDRDEMPDDLPSAPPTPVAPMTAEELHEIIPRHSVKAIRNQRSRVGRYSPDAVPLCQRCGEHPVWEEAADARRWGLCKACALEERAWRSKHGGELSRKDNALRQARFKARHRKEDGRSWRTPSHACRTPGSRPSTTALA